MLLYICSISFLVTTLVTGQSIIISPRNTAAKRGTAARLNCTADLQGDSLEWRHYLEKTTGDRIVASTDPNDIPDNRFDLDYDVDSGRYDLIIKSLNDDLVGRYLCHVLTANVRREVQTVSLSSLVCDSVGDTSNVTVGTRLSLTCSVTYKGYKHPNLKWYSGDTAIHGEYTEPPDTTNSIVYTAQITIEESHIGTPFRCELDFVPAPGDQSEPPIYTDSCNITFGDAPGGSTWPSTGSGRRAEYSFQLVATLVMAIALRRTVEVICS